MNLFGVVIGKMKVLEWHLSRKWDFSIYSYKYDKWEGWTCTSMSLDAKMIFKPRLFRFRWTGSMRMCLNDPWLENDLNRVYYKFDKLKS